MDRGIVCGTQGRRKEGGVIGGKGGWGDGGRGYVGVGVGGRGWMDGYRL